MRGHVLDVCLTLMIRRSHYPRTSVYRQPCQIGQPVDTDFWAERQIWRWRAASRSLLDLRSAAVAGPAQGCLR